MVALGKNIKGVKEMKQNATYQQPSLQIIVCGEADVVTASAGGSLWNENWNFSFSLENDESAS